MTNRTMSSWEKNARNKDLAALVTMITTDKINDALKLKNSDLPQPIWHQTIYANFNQNNRELMNYLNKLKQIREGVCVRAIPNELAKKRGGIRNNKLGYLSLEEMQNFLRSNTDNKKDWSVLMSSWTPQPYGGVIISKPDKIYAEISNTLNEVAYGTKVPLVSLRGPSLKAGKPTTRRYLIKENPEAQKYLQEAIETIGSREGYFEFVVKDNKKIMFVDFKPNAFLF